MRNQIILLFTILIISCNSRKVEYGRVSGNVFWKYPESGEDRPDGGSEITLYNIDNRSSRFHAQADVRGDYVFENIPVGEYLVITISSNAKDDEFGVANSILNHEVFFDTIFQTKLRNLVGVLYDKAKTFNGILLFKNSLPPDVYLRLVKDNRDSSNLYSREILNLLPLEIKMAAGINGNDLYKIAVNIVWVVKSQTQRIVTNFGYPN